MRLPTSTAKKKYVKVASDSLKFGSKAVALRLVKMDGDGKYMAGLGGR